MSTPNTTVLGPNQVRCPRCRQPVHRSGLSRHVGSKKCINAGGSADPPLDTAVAAAAVLDTALNREYDQETNAVLTALGLQTRLSQPVDGNSGPRTGPQQNTIDDRQPDFLGQHDFNPIGPQSNEPEDHNGRTNMSGPNVDDIKIVYHPNSGKNETIMTFDEYASLVNEADAASASFEFDTLDRIPWRPFRTRLDFELAEVMLDTHMNFNHAKRTIAVVNAAARDSPHSDFTLQGPDELVKIWDAARSARAAGFLTKTISVPYSGDELNYNVWWLPVWDWCRELLTNQDIVRRFNWDAVRLHKFDGERFERFIDEPWTAQKWWDFQTSIPAAAKPLCLILYADETRLSSFGTEKGHPVIVRCANLPIAIRNGRGVGGARTIGWLPIPPEPASEANKTKWVNHKREVWHTSVTEILASIQPFTKLGTSIRCGDGITRLIYPTILILSADYDEASDMALTRGVLGNHPCPICLVPRGEQSILSVEYPLRTSREMEEQLEEARGLGRVREREAALRDIGLRNVKNAFWALDGTDVHSALSWDRLHAYHLGLFEDHLLSELRDTILADLGRGAQTAVDKGLDDIPRWANLNHFDSLASTSKFADGTKLEDLSKVILYASQHVLTEETSEIGFLMLQLIRSYLELDLFSSLTVQTEATIAMGRLELKTFENLLERYKVLDPEKNWDFPKCHSHQHVFRDILQKGATRNYNTKPNEQLHGPLKRFYQNNTNFKNVASQILRVNELDVISTIIRTGINALDEVEEQHNAAARESVEGSSEPQAVASAGSQHDQILFGSRRPQATIARVQLENADQPEFNNLLQKFRKFITAELQLGNRRPSLDDNHPITQCQLIKVQYVSVVDWRFTTSILRANPNFHHHPRFDHALVRIDGPRGDEAVFVQIVGLFELSYKGKAYKTALVLPLDQPRAQDAVRRRRDRLLRLTRVQPRRKQDTVIINANSIIRGGLLAEDYASDSSERLLVNFTDQDMWLRMKSVDLKQHVGF